jgi:hypothetical protein
MKVSKSAVAVTAAATLLIAQTATAAVPRTGSPVAESEELGGAPAALPFLAVFAIFFVTGAVILLTDDDDSPVSP